MSQLCHKNMSYVLALRTIISSLIPIRAQYIRNNFFELTRILNHIMQLQRMQLMLSINSIFMGFEERESIMNFMSVFLVHVYIVHNFRPGA